MHNEVMEPTINSSEGNSTPPNSVEGVEFFKEGWIGPQITTIIFLLFTLWSIVALSKYGHRKGKWNREKKNRDQLILMTLATLTPCITLIRVLFTQFVIITGQVSTEDEKGDYMCEILMDFSVVFLFSATIMPYFFLWKRQRILYSHPALKRLNNMFISFLSYLVVLMLSVGGLGTCILLIVPTPGYRMSHYGCVKSDLESGNSIPLYIAAAISITSQLIIFGLFAHPLRYHQNFTSTANSGISDDTTKRLQRANVLATISLSICISADLLALILVAIVLPKSMPRQLSSTIYDLSLCFNIFSVVVSYEDWREILMCSSGTAQINETHVMQTVLSISTGG